MMKMSKIIDGIYVGGWSNASNEVHLENEEITHIVSAHEMSSNPFKNHHKERKYLRIEIDDIESANIRRHFSESNKFIHQARLEGGRVLIHCQMGVSRSVALTCAYLLAATKLSLDEVMESIRAARFCASPNPGFMQQLRTYETIELPMERKRLQDMFGVSKFLESDTAQLLQNISGKK